MSNKKGTKKSSDDEKTKKMKMGKENKKKTKKKGKHPKLMLALKILLVIIVICIIIAAGVVAGVVFGLFGDKFDVNELKIENQNSVVVDKNGEVIASLNGDENREIISLEEMGKYIPKAFVAIEDERFYKHNGVDLKRTIGATVQYVIRGGKSNYGGSTITQQLIKNATKENEKDWTRKVKEIVRAYQVETVMSKDQILESYLNIIPLGGGGKNVHGVQIASRYYFDKKPSELTMAQSAYLAGINNAPNTYNPFKENPNTEKIKTRTINVLWKMNELGLITKEEYQSAQEEVNNGLAFKEGTISNGTNLDWHTETAISQIINQMVEEKGIDEKTAKATLYGGGYTIHTTQDKSIQSTLNEAYNNSGSDWIKTKSVTRTDNEGNKKKETVQLQSGMVIIDHTNGQVVGAAGGLGEKTAWGTNRITSAGHQPGSSIKPVAVIAPSMQEGLITAGTVVDDTPVSYGSYVPKNDTRNYYGLMNIRHILRVSRNIPEVKMVQKLTPTKSIEYLKTFGITTLSGDEGLSLALGSASKGISPLEMAGAYATLANKGVYIEPTFYTKIEDSNGKVILEAKQESHRVLSEQNAWLVQSLLTEPTGTGLTGTQGATGTRANISGMQTCGKTGTTNDTTATWFCGFTPYYTASMYFGFDNPKDGGSGVPGSGTVAGRWGTIMKKIHSGLDSKTFEKPSGLTTAKICKDSGLLATENCEQDPRGSRTYSEYYTKGTAPTKSCECHVKLKICKDSGKIANEFCTNVEEKVFITRPNSDSETSWKQAADAQYMAPTETCNQHTKKADTEKPVITLKNVNKDTLEVKLNAKFSVPEASAKDNVDGDLTKNIKIEIKKDGKVVDKIDTSKVGNYIITYTVEDSSKNVATKTLNVKIIKDTNAGNNTVNGNTTNTTNTVN